MRKPDIGAVKPDIGAVKPDIGVVKPEIAVDSLPEIRAQSQGCVRFGGAGLCRFKRLSSNGDCKGGDR